MNDITSSFNMRDNRYGDSNSIRTLGKSEHSHGNMTRSHSPTKLHNQNHFQNKTFQFQEPSKSNNTNYNNNENNNNNNKNNNNNNNSTLTKQNCVKMKRSRLDMLDNSQLTSFPLAPPPSSEKVTESLKSPEINAQEPQTSRPDSQLFEIDPIVLVEDYIKSKQLGGKKLSVIDLKTSLRTFDSMDPMELPQGPNYLTHAKSILSGTSSQTISSSSSSRGPTPHIPSSQTSSLLLTKCSADESSIATSDFYSAKTQPSTDFYSAKTQPSLSSACSIHTNVSSTPTLKLTDTYDLTLGEFSMPCTSSLKYCVVCETPLYELSSLLTDDSKASGNYSEFVCSNCTERYEMLSKLIENFDMMTSIPEEGSINDLEELLEQPATKKLRGGQTSNGFSTHLINKLQNQLHCNSSNFNTSQQIDRKSAMWLLEAKEKLRWRWRISGLLPQFLKRD